MGDRIQPIITGTKRKDNIDTEFDDLIQNRTDKFFIVS